MTKDRPANPFDLHSVRDIDLQALADGQLDPALEKNMRRLLAHDAAARSRYRELLEQKRLLVAWWQHLS